MTDQQHAFAALVILGLAVHLVVDWYLQNDWQARNKATIRHPAGIVHAGMHGVAMLLVFPAWAALTVFVTHYLIDLRRPLIWWRQTMRQTTDPANPASLHVAMWQDQIAHWLIIGGIAWIVTT